MREFKEGQFVRLSDEFEAICPSLKGTVVEVHDTSHGEDFYGVEFGEYANYLKSWEDFRPWTPLDDALE